MVKTNKKTEKNGEKKEEKIIPTHLTISGLNRHCSPLYNGRNRKQQQQH